MYRIKDINIIVKPITYISKNDNKEKSFNEYCLEIKLLNGKIITINKVKFESDIINQLNCYENMDMLNKSVIKD